MSVERPHRFPKSLDGDIVAWCCAACRQWVSEYRADASMTDTTPLLASSREALARSVLDALRDAWRDDHSPMTVANGVADALLSSGIVRVEDPR